ALKNDKIPDAIQAPRGQTRMFTAQAEGVQIYVSEPAGKGFRWTFKAPLANLSAKGEHAGYHYAGPAWELKGGCKVVRDDTVPVASAPSPEGDGNIPWLLIKLKADDSNQGRLTGATYVQRV